jgi:hypothetical protein
MGVNRLRILVPAAALLVVVACAKPAPPATEASASTEPAAQAGAEDLAAREAELKIREAELAAREASLAQAQSPAPASSTGSAAASRPVAKPAPAAAPVASKPSPAVAKPAPAPAPQPLVVPEGTQLSLALTEEVSTKTAKVGDTIRATVVSDVRVDGKLAIAAGTTVAGQVTDVVSGSNKIGGVPRLGMSFDRLELPGNRDVPISGLVSQRGKSDNTRDTVKIVGGAAAGAILGNEVKGGDKVSWWRVPNWPSRWPRPSKFRAEA